MLLELLMALGLPAVPREDSTAQAPDDPAPPRIEEEVDVVAVTPLHGLGIAREKVPWNVQVLTLETMTPGRPDLPARLAEEATGVHLSEAQGGDWQPDLLFRGFAGSPLLGASEGLAIYQDGVRLNEAFGDTVNWDALPVGAIASINLMPGSNPVFGLNALGGALSIATKDGFSAPGTRAAVSTGSFGRRQLQAETGGSRDRWGYFLAGSMIDEDGWRAFSPSTLRRLFADVEWRGDAWRIDTSLTAASNDLIGNGAVPAALYEADHTAVFTHPDRTDNDLALVTIGARRPLSSASTLEAVAYYRYGRIGTFNGDAADDDDDGPDGFDDDFDEDDEAGELEFEGVNNRSRTRTRAAGVTGQLTHTARIAGGDNQLTAGAGVDSAWTAFDFSAEWAHLTPERGTIGTGLMDPDAFIDLDTRATTASAFLVSTWSARDSLHVTASARANWSAVRLRDRLGTALDGDHTFLRVNPAAGISYQPSRAVGLYGSYAQSSRVPTPVELTCADPEDPCRLPNAFVSDPPLNLVVARTWEGGVRGRAATLAWTGTIFRTSSTDDIVFVSSGTQRGAGHFENVPETLRWGVETRLTAGAGLPVSGFVTYTFQQAEYGSDLRLASPFHPAADDGEIAVSRGDRLPGIPSHVGRAGVTAHFAPLELALTVRAQSSIRLRGDESNELEPLAGFTLVNVRGRYPVTPRVAVTGEVHNLFDRRHATFGVLGSAELVGIDDDPRFYSPGAPRAAWIGIDVMF